MLITPLADQAASRGLDDSTWVSRRRLAACLAALGCGVGADAIARAASSPQVPRPEQPRLKIPLALIDGASRVFIDPLLELLGVAAGIEWQIQHYPLARMLAVVDRGQALGFSVARTPEREQTLEFSDTVVTAYSWAVSMPQNARAFRRLDDLRGESVCVMRGASLSEDLDRAGPDALHKEVFGPSLEQGIAMLRAGRCRYLALTSHRGPAPTRLAEDLRGIGGGGLSLLPLPLPPRTSHFAVLRNHPIAAVMPRLNAAIRQQREAISALVHR